MPGVRVREDSAEQSDPSEPEEPEREEEAMRMSESGELKSTPVCPHCGHIERDAWEMDFGPGFEGEIETDCGSCGREYIVSRIVHVSYKSAVLQEMGDGS